MKEKIEKLTDIQYYVTQENGTEKPFDNLYWNHFEEGIYVDIVSGEPLFLSSQKFDSQCGWPSFFEEIIENNIVELVDNSLVFPRVEVRSPIANSHLGHVFDDGPEPTGIRYCINSASIRFIARKDMKAEGFEKFLTVLDRARK